jgi:enolase-phosphatase E1
VTLSLSALQARALLLDIEGVTTPIAFVYDVLFPFARAHAADYLEAGEPAGKRAVLDMLREEQGVDRERGEHPPAPILDYVIWLMDRDRKSPGLKALQGLIWREGYETGALHGEVYPDASPAFARWRAGGFRVFIYSSGSVLAQQLLFGSTKWGDLKEFIEDYFDTAVGPKTAASSYLTIAKRMRLHTEEILFVSDVVQELDAAREAGLHTALCVRGDRGQPPACSHPVIRTLDEIAE